MVDNFFSPLNTFTLHFAILTSWPRLNRLAMLSHRATQNDPFFIFEVDVLEGNILALNFFCGTLFSAENLAYSTGTFSRSKIKPRPHAQNTKVTNQSRSSRTVIMSNFKKI